MQTFIRGALIACATVFATATQAQDYPNRPVTIVIPFPVGSQADIINRMIFDKMERSLGQKVVVENRPGAGGTVGSDRVAKAAPDGYTLLSGSAGTHAASISLFRNVPYDPVKDFVPIAMLSGGANVLAVHSSVGVKTLAELIALAKAQPNKLTYASSGNGTTPHFQGALLTSLAGVEIRHVPYSSITQAATDLARGDVSMMFYAFAPIRSFVEQGQLVMLGTSGDVRSATLPQLPTLREAGLTGYSLMAWSALFGPAGLPQPIVQKLYATTQDALKDSELQTKIVNLGTEVLFGDPQYVASLQKVEIEKYRRLVEATGARLD
jgi:tripartite-type tricarboxylate transporter receptor subunit TctC